MDASEAPDFAVKPLAAWPAWARSSSHASPLDWARMAVASLSIYMQVWIARHDAGLWQPLAARGTVCGIIRMAVASLSIYLQVWIARHDAGLWQPLANQQQTLCDICMVCGFTMWRATFTGKHDVRLVCEHYCTWWPIKGTWLKVVSCDLDLNLILISEEGWHWQGILKMVLMPNRAFICRFGLHTTTLAFGSLLQISSRR
jgi:hypothetical protein